MREDQINRLLPMLIGAGLVGAGIALRHTEPRLLSLPDPTPLSDDSDHGALVSAAQSARDGIAEIMPSNLGSALARSLIVTGAAMLAIRLLDEVTARAR